MQGRVSSVNRKGTGFKLDIAPDQWINISKYGDAPHEPPPRGALVEVEIGDDGFASSITILSGGSAPSSAGPADPGAYVPREDVRGPIITRLTCLKAAADWLKDRGEAKSTDVLLVAALWSGWAESGELPAACKKAAQQVSGGSPPTEAEIVEEATKVIGASLSDGELPPSEQPQPVCNDCKKIIVGLLADESPDGQAWPALRIAGAGIKHFGVPLCGNCFHERKMLVGVPG